MTNLDSIFKSRDIPLPTKVRLVKAMVIYNPALSSRKIPNFVKVSSLPSKPVVLATFPLAC